MSDPRRRSVRRLVVGHIVAFGMITLVAAAATYLLARHQLVRQLDANVAARMAMAQRKVQRDGLRGMDAWLDALSERGGHFSYILTGPDGAHLRSVDGVGPVQPGWGMTRFNDEDDDSIDPARTLTARLPDGSTLTIIADRDYIEQFDAVLIGFLAFALPLLLLTAIVGSLSLEANVRRRLADVNATAAAIMDGALEQRVPLGGTNDEFDRLSATLNRMLDRIAALIGEVRRVTAYVAHDLRTPLIAIAGDLRGATDPHVGSTNQALSLHRAAEAADRLIDLFGMILELGEINPVRVRESGKPFDLSELVETLAGAHVAVAEDGGRRLTCSVDENIGIYGMHDLLAQALLNLVQNALTHTPPASHIHIALDATGDTARLIVVDDGPGMDEAERARVLVEERLSRSEEGSTRAAFGLKLVRAIVGAHRGTFALEDAGPGLRAVITLPRARA